MYDANRLFVVALAHVKLGGLENGEGDEADEKENQGYAADSDHEVAPAHVLGLGAIGVCSFAGPVT